MGVRTSLSLIRAALRHPFILNSSLLIINCYKKGPALSVMSLTENLKFHLILVKNQHRICMCKYTWAEAQTHRSRKREDSF